MPRVTVVIPVRDRPALVQEAIASVLAQTWSDLALVVVDDGSTDETADAVAAALATASVPTRLLRRPPAGVAAARNAGAAAVDSAWIAFLDSDDLWLPAKLARQMAWVDGHPTHRLVQTEERWLDAGRHRNPRAWHRKEEALFLRSLARCLVSPSAVVIRRDLWASCGGFDEAFALCEDYELWLRLTRTEPVGLVPEPLVVKRGGHPGQLSRSTWGLDRWRVAALAKLLLGAPLGDDERAAACRIATAKCALLAAGAARRGRNAEAARYATLGAAIAGTAASVAPAAAAAGCA